jgi:hypothetical protein
MKTLKAICAATVLALSLSAATYADDTTPGDSHSPGSPRPICGSTTSGDTDLIDGATAVEGDISFSALADMLWTVASIF